MFRFKQFTINQDRTAMKVCTDACVLGAYANVGSGGRILDIGTGTGLLALMAAQRNPTVVIDAVELDEAAFQQATVNVADSPFAAQVHVLHQRIQDFTSAEQYDRILTNPPFYTNHLRSPDEAVNRALHTDELPFAELISAASRLLKPSGQWWVLLPPYEAGLLVGMAQEQNFWLVKRLALKHHLAKPAFRVIMGLARQSASVEDEILPIYELDGKTYTTAFSSLLRDFYLIF